MPSGRYIKRFWLTCFSILRVKHICTCTLQLETVGSSRTLVHRYPCIGIQGTLVHQYPRTGIQGSASEKTLVILSAVRTEYAIFIFVHVAFCVSYQLSARIFGGSPRKYRVNLKIFQL
jgi:hypothetical protein